MDADTIRRSYADAKPRPFWLDQADAPGVTEPLAGEHEADLVIVGGGLTGLWAALLAREEQPQRAVVLLEGERIAFGASGRNGGFMDASLTHGIENGVARWPDEMPKLERLGRENFAAVKDTIASRGIDANLEQTGELAFASAAYQAEYIPEMVETARSFGWAAEALDADEARAEVHSPTYHGGVYLPDSCAVLDPARLAWGLAAAALAAGARVFERSQVVRLAAYGPGVVAETQRFPQLEGLRFSHRWGGAIDTCSRFSVMFGKALGGRAVYSVGYTGLGVGASRFGAQVALDLADDRDTERTRLKMVRSKPIPFPPEPLRWAAISLTRRALAKADREDGRRGPWLRTLDRFGLGFDS